jgi:hypothetical protein
LPSTSGTPSTSPSDLVPTARTRMLPMSRRASPTYRSLHRWPRSSSGSWRRSPFAGPHDVPGLDDVLRRRLAGDCIANDVLAESMRMIQACAKPHPRNRQIWEFAGNRTGLERAHLDRDQQLVSSENDGGNAELRSSPSCLALAQMGRSRLRLRIRWSASLPRLAQAESSYAPLRSHARKRLSPTTNAGIPFGPPLEQQEFLVPDGKLPFGKRVVATRSGPTTGPRRGRLVGRGRSRSGRACSDRPSHACTGIERGGRSR